jgi:hypothetical protein
LRRDCDRSHRSAAVPGDPRFAAHYTGANPGVSCCAIWPWPLPLVGVLGSPYPGGSLIDKGDDPGQIPRRSKT